MCILMFTPPGATIPEHQLITACNNNPDGFGWATIRYEEGGRSSIVSFRSMDAREAIDSFLEYRKLDDTMPALFHARIATHGTVDLDNCHPFYVGGDGQTMLAHNGVMPIDERDGKSDTRLFAEEWLPEIGIESLDNPEEVWELERFIGWSKVVILSVDPRLKQWYYILNEGQGHWENGVWYSNYTYQQSRYTSGGGWGNWGAANSYLDNDECPHCLADTSHMYGRWCGLCGGDLYNPPQDDDSFDGAFASGNYFVNPDGTIFISNSNGTFSEATIDQYRAYIAWLADRQPARSHLAVAR